MSRKNGRGGCRKGAGRPVGKGRVKGEPTQMMRVPVSLKAAIKRLIQTQEYQVPVFTTSARAGLPTHVPDEYPDKVGLVEYVTEHPEETFLVRAEGDSMINANIHDGDMLVVDERLEARDGAIVVASVDGDCLVKRLRRVNGTTILMPENDDYAAIPIGENTAFHVWGVVKKKIGDVG